MLRWVPSRVLERTVRLTGPSYTLGAACRIERDGQVLLVQTAYRRAWGMPGGLLKRHESPADGVRREVREEVGVDIDLVGEPIVVIDSDNRLVDFLFRGELAGDATVDQVHPASTEIASVCWFPLDDVGRVVGGPDRMGEKLASYDRHPHGGLVFLEPKPSRRDGHRR
jgi:8-oxo-dGTP diphosphatase